MGIIYRPGSRAEEFSHLGANFYRGCYHGCFYCYVPDYTHNNDFFTEQSVRKDVLWQLRREAPNFAGTDERVLLCFTCDPYQPLDIKEQITRQAIEILRANNVPFQILTKGGMRAARDFDLYGPDDIFGTTLTLLDEDKSKLHEPQAAVPEDRIAAIKLAKEKGIETWASLEPVIEPTASLEIIRQTHRIVDHYRIGKMNHCDKLTAQEWRRFGNKAIQLCREFKVDYYIKADLAKYLDGIHFYNTDKRKVKED